MAFLLILRFVMVEIKSWVLSGVHYVVAGPLVCNRVDDEVFIIFAELVGSGAPAGENRGWAVPSKKRTFDSTMGFPGEDVAEQPSEQLQPQPELFPSQL